MSIKTILVNLNDEPRVKALIAAACSVARPADAHVIGLYVMPPLIMPGDVIMPMGMDFYNEQMDRNKAQAERIKTVFNESMKDQTFTSEWIVSGEAQSSYEPIADGVIAQAQSAGVVIVSQAADDASPPMLSALPERVAMESGRPVLVIPTTWEPSYFGKYVMIAWNNSRESARATFDALPMLGSVESIRLLTLAERFDDGRAPTLSAADIANTLARHGFDVEIEAVPVQDRSAGEIIVSKATANRADMIVMGAYGHSRLREFILGGATRDVLRHMTVPTLLSH